MGGRTRFNTGRLTPEQMARLEELRARCAHIERIRGQTDTAHHTELASLEALAASRPEPEAKENLSNDTDS